MSREQRARGIKPSNSSPQSYLGRRRARERTGAIPFLRTWVVVALFVACSARAETANPSALEIFDGALAKFEADRAALHQWQYHQTLTTHQLDAAGNVTAKGTWRSIVR